ncbi:hypothetical protein V8E36_001520 [Tilletia maclaganii]
MMPSSIRRTQEARLCFGWGLVVMEGSIIISMWARVAWVNATVETRKENNTFVWFPTSTQHPQPPRRAPSLYSVHLSYAGISDQEVVSSEVRAVPPHLPATANEDMYTSSSMASTSMRRQQSTESTVLHLDIEHRHPR